MKSIIRFILPAAAILVAFFLVGCSSNPTLATSASTQNLTPGKFQPLTDVPVPGGAKLDTESSVILGSPDHWVGRAVLNTSMSMAEATVFYQNQMPSFGWELISVSQGKVANMTFTRPDRVASMQIEPKTFGGSTVTILMSPREAKPEPPPTK